MHFLVEQTLYNVVFVCILTCVLSGYFLVKFDIVFPVLSGVSDEGKQTLVLIKSFILEGAIRFTPSKAIFVEMKQIELIRHNSFLSKR